MSRLKTPATSVQNIHTKSYTGRDLPVKFTVKQLLAGRLRAALLALNSATMRYWLTVLLLTALLAACVDAFEPDLRATVDVIVVDGTVTNLAEPQQIRLNRSRADPLTGRFGTLPLTKATVEVIVDSSQVIYAHETVDGTYQLPNDFRGQVGHSYQLRFHLPDGTEYRSTPQVMPTVPPIARVHARFNAKSLASSPLNGFFTAGHDIYIDTQDPADQHNYYRWDWTLYERQYYCRSCEQGVYAVNNIIPHKYRYDQYYVSGTDLYEDCFTPVDYHDYGQPPFHAEPWVYDYFCRTQCWEIIHNYTLNLFDDLRSNGGGLAARNVGQIPLYQRAPCLVDIRQTSLTPDAYRYYSLLQQQTQNTGGLADTPPSAPVGNVHNAANAKEAVVGYFTASAVSLGHHWLDRKDAQGVGFGETDPQGPHVNLGDDLFYALNLRRPYLEPQPPYNREQPKVLIWGGPPRVPTAVCVSSESRTPSKPEGWRD